VSFLRYFGTRNRFEGVGHEVLHNNDPPF
jgi:hypothetical protein